MFRHSHRLGAGIVFAAAALAASFLLSCSDGGGATAPPGTGDLSAARRSKHAGLATITVSPGSASLPEGGQQNFTAAGKDALGNTVAIAPSWSVAGGGGTITASGAFTAGTVPGTFASTVVASSGGVSGSASVTVTAPAIGLTPTSLSFAAQAGGSNPAGQVLTDSNAGTGTLAWTATRAQGSAWLTISPASGTAPSSIAVSVTVGALAAGTYRDTIVVTAVGAANTPQKVPVTFAVTAAAGGYKTPDILGNASFEPGDLPNQWDGLTDWGGRTPAPYALSTQHAYSGSYAVQRALPITSGTDIGGELADISFKGTHASYDRVWSRFYFYLDAAITGTLKFHIFMSADGNTQLGGLGIQGGYINFSPLGYTSGGASEWSGAGYRLTPLSTLVNGWHSIEIDYWRNGDIGGNVFTTGAGEPSIAVWLDGTQLTSGIGSPPSPGYWKNGRIYVGQRTTSAQLGFAEWAGVLNGTPANTIPANLWLDRVGLSSLGRIGP